MNTIEEQFVSYQVEVIPEGASETQLRETQRAFYAGAAAIMAILIKLEAQSLPDEQLEAEILDITLELKLFENSLREIGGAQI